MQFIVTQEPKQKERGALVCHVIVVEAKTKAEALRLAHAHISRENYFCKPKVAVLANNRCYTV